MKRRLAASLAIAMTLCSCRRHDSPVRLTTDEAAHTYVRLALALGERDSDSIDMYRGPAAWQRDARARYATLDAIRAESEAIADRLEDQGSRESRRTAADEPERRRFLARQLKSIVARIDILRRTRPRFPDEVRRLFDLDVKTPSSDASVDIRSEIDRLLPGATPLPARYAAFDRRYLIAPERLESVLKRAIAGCRAATMRHVDLPKDEHVDIELGSNMPWSAYTKYQGGFASRIIVNADLPLTVDRALDLACHEAYPGHHVIYAILEQRFRNDRVELLVQPLFSPQSMVHEAAASLAPSLAFSNAERLAFERDELFPAAGLDPLEAERYVRVSRLVDRLHIEEGRIIANYLDGALDFPRASSALERDALMPGPDLTLKFVNQFRSYAATYTFGRDVFAARVGLDWAAYLRAVSEPSYRMDGTKN